MQKLTFTVDEMGDLMGISRPKAYELANRKDFPSIHIGRRILISRVALEAWLQEQTQK